MKYYVLRDKQAFLASSMLEWAEFLANSDRSVAQTTLDDTRISTVFLGFDLRHFSKDDPLLFETIVFLPDGHPFVGCRYFTWAEAQSGHDEIVGYLRDAQATAANITIDAIASAMSNSAYRINRP